MLYLLLWNKTDDKCICYCYGIICTERIYTYTFIYNVMIEWLERMIINIENESSFL